MIWLYYSYALVAFAIVATILWGATIIYIDRKKQQRIKCIEKIIDPQIELRETWQLYAIHKFNDRKVN